MAIGPNVRPVSPFAADQGGTEVVTVEHNGEVFEVEVPKGTSDAQVQAFVQQQAAPTSPGQVQFGDDPSRVATRLSPEDEAHVAQLVKEGRYDEIGPFAHSRGFAFNNEDQLRQAAATGNASQGDVAYSLAKAPDMGAGAAFQNGVSQGASLGFSDELHGLINGATSAVRGNGFSDAYNRTVDADRAQLGADEENHWLASLTGNLAGGLVLPLGLERAGLTQSTAAIGAATRDAALAAGDTLAAANKAAARAVAHRLATEGAAYGGLYGAGASEGGPGERLLGGGIGAVTGAVAGGLVAPGIAKLATAARRGVNAGATMARDAVGAITQSGAQDRAGALLRGAALRPIDEILDDIAARGPQASGAQPTLGEVANDVGLAGFQRGYANGDQRAGAAIGERNAANALARTGYVSDSLGDGSPQAIQDFAGGQTAAGEAATAAQQAERQAAAEARIAAGREQAAGYRQAADAGLVAAREGIGAPVDRTATGSTAREAFGNAYEAAKQRSREAYSAPVLKQAQPIEIPKAVFQRVRDAADEFYGDGGGEIPSQLRSIIDDMADQHATTRTLTNIDRRLADFAGEAGMSGRNSEAAFAKRIRGDLAAFVEQAAPKEYRDALANAKAVRAEQGRIFETGDAPKAFARDRYGNPTVGDTTVPTRIVRPGAPGGDTIDGLISAVGPDTAETLVRQELRRVLEEGGVQTEAQARSLASRYGEVARRFPGVQSDLAAVQSSAARLDQARAAQTAAEQARVTAAEQAAIRERSALHNTILASPLGKVADSAVDPSSFVAGLLKHSDDGRQLRYLARQVSGDDAATNGLRRAIGDYIINAGAGPSYTAAGNRVPGIAGTRKAIETVVKRAGEALTPQQKVALKNVSRELTSANFAATAGRPAGSDTQMNRNIERLIQATPSIGHTGPVKSVLLKIVSALSNEEEVRRLITQAVLDPDFAATLLKRPTERHLIDASERLAGRKGTVLVANPAVQGEGQYKAYAQ